MYAGPLINGCSLALGFTERRIIWKLPLTPSRKKKLGNLLPISTQFFTFLLVSTRSIIPLIKHYTIYFLYSPLCQDLRLPPLPFLWLFSNQVNLLYFPVYSPSFHFLKQILIQRSSPIRAELTFTPSSWAQVCVLLAAAWHAGPLAGRAAGPASS